MGVLIDHEKPFSSSIRKEIELKKTLRNGHRGQAVRRVQEWLTLHGQRIVIDSDYGPATEGAVRAFQQARRLQVDGVVGPNTHAKLIGPLHKVLSPIKTSNRSFAQLTLAYAKKHLAEHPLEVGGQNKGPWVRLYMDGNEGTQWAWCAGFVTFVMKQAAQTLDVPMPIRGSVSCDTLAAQAREAGIFVSEQQIRQGKVSLDELTTASIFLVRRTPTDWVHTGLVSDYQNELFNTIEGNTNDEGHREGYEVCARIRGYGKKDFIRL